MLYMARSVHFQGLRSIKAGYATLIEALDGDEWTRDRAGELVRGGFENLPPLIVAAGEKVCRRFIEFFTANIRNRNTRPPTGARPGSSLRGAMVAGLPWVTGAVRLVYLYRGAPETAFGPVRETASGRDSDAL